ncbi:Spy/CpxP family protein refolding chaperone [Xanthobacter sp. TB0139]|uniref:Spy/CpxP family protein refolding chaperone n=1 Tax=Xanthobacter sp. TB0139 TaxID=3459178 RepID=UPI004039E91A
MKKAVIAATAAFLVAGTAAYAGPGGMGGPGGPGPRGGWTAEDRALVMSARLAAVKDVLKLNADQDKLWTKFETTLLEVNKERMETRQQMREAHREARQEARAKGERPAFDPITRMRTAADRMDERAASMRKVADAAAPLYESLDDAQKQRLSVLMRSGLASFFGGPGAHGYGPGMRGPGGPGMGKGGPGMRGPGMMGKGQGMGGPGMMAPADDASGDDDTAE